MSNIKYISSANIDEDKWDKCVNSDAYPLVYGNVWFLDLVCKEWDALIYGDYEAVLPLPFKVKFGLYYLYRPYGVQQLGVFGDASKTKELLKAIPSKFLWIDIFLNANNSITKGKNFLKQQNLTINLNKSYEEIYSSYNKRTVRNLKKAKKTRFTDFGYDNPEGLITLFRNNKGKHLKSLGEEHYSKMLQIMHVLLHKGIGHIYTLYTEPNHLCAGMFLVEWKNRIIFLFSATDDIGKESQAMTKLLDEFFIIHSEKNILFDFEGSNIDSLAAFYKGFGAEVETYYNFQNNKLPIPKKLIQKIF